MLNHKDVQCVCGACIEIQGNSKQLICDDCVKKDEERTHVFKKLIEKKK